MINMGLICFQIRFLMRSGIILLFLSLSGSLFGMDSLRLAAIEGHPYIIHKVEKGDTYFSLTKRYKVSDESIENVNPGSKESLKLGQELRIPIAFDGVYKHKIIAGQTLFSLYRIYGVRVEKIKELNGLESDEVSIGQELVIFKPEENLKKEDERPLARTHKVEKGETLFSVSRLYGLKWQDLQNLNNLENTELKPGQILLVSIDSGLTYVPPKPEDPPVSGIHIVQEEETLYSIGRKYGTTPGDLMTKNQLESIDLSPGQELKIFKDTIETKEMVSFTTTPDEYMGGEKSKEVVMVGDVEKVIERGVCELIEGGEDTYKYLGLHKTLPRGTIVQVKNAENQASVFVKIIGSIPDIDQNSPLILKVSPRAFKALGAVNKKFRVEIYYFPDQD